MDTQLLQDKFERMGARMKFSEQSREAGVIVNILKDHRGEFFDLSVNAGTLEDVRVIDLRPRERHLLLMVERDKNASDPAVAKQKFLCGHDERHWFVAAVPEESHAANVRTAMDALKPGVVRVSEGRLKVKARKRYRRKNEAFVRQGEWFFLPTPSLVVNPVLILRHEPLRRGAGKPHWVDELVRLGGQTVYVSPQFPNGLSPAEHAAWVRQHPRSHVQWRIMVRDAEVFVRGRVRHPDHQTIRLNGWHRVAMNTETRAAAMRNVAFLDRST